MNQTASYTATAIRLHWLMAIGLAGTSALGLYMHELPLSPMKLQFYAWHKWAGVTLFALLLLRLSWRLAHRPPGAPIGMPAWQLLAAEVAHRLLYVLMVAIPLSGWLMSSAKGYQTVLFGVLPLPDLLAKDKELGDLLATAHRFLNFAMAGLVLVHVGAAIKHHRIDRDGVMQRMLPFLKNR